MDYTPVCDCNGNTHANLCNAQTAGVSVLHVGECVADDDSGGGDGVVIASIGDSESEPVKSMMCTLPNPTATIANGTADDALTILPTPFFVVLRWHGGQ